jgi:hypothetical protein
MENKRPLSTIVIKIPNNNQNLYFSVGENGVMIGNCDNILGFNSSDSIEFDSALQMCDELIQAVELMQEYLKDGK